MLQFDGGQAATTNVFPNWPAPSSPVNTGAAVLGPSNQAVGVLIATFNTLVDLQVAYRQKDAPGWGMREGPVIQGLYPAGYVFPQAIAFRVRSHNPNAPAQVIGQVWESQDGPLPASPLSPNTAFLSSQGTIAPSAMISGWAGAGGGTTTPGAWTSFGATAQLTVSQAGTYIFSGGWWGNNSAGAPETLQVSLMKNGVYIGQTQGSVTVANGSDFESILVPIQLPLVVGDVINLAYFAQAAVSIGLFALQWVTTAP